MKRFLLKITPYIIIILALYAFLGSYADGNADHYYLRFTSPKQQSLILGNSRAAQGLQPNIFNETLKHSTLYNYAFNISISPYGPAYLKAIQNKIEPETKNGIFILQVDPWSISNPKKANTFKEDKSFINRLHQYNSSPNYEYLLKYYYESWFHLYQYNASQGKKSIFLNEDGWLSVTMQLDSVEYEQSEKEKIKSYSQRAKGFQLHPDRVEYFKKTLQYLQNYGQVYLVRLPQSEKFQTLEHNYMPHFDSLIEEISTHHEIPYFNFMQSPHIFEYTDGNHLNIKSGAQVSKQIADSIIFYQKNKTL